MARRSKRDMELMNQECRFYLLQTGLNYHKAYDLFIKDHLENTFHMPYYIKGIKDFKAISEEMAVELNRKEQMNKQDQARATAKEEVMQFIMKLTKDEITAIWKAYKDTVTHADKLNIVDVHMCIHSDDMKESYINQSTINTFTKIYQEQLQTA